MTPTSFPTRRDLLFRCVAATAGTCGISGCGQLITSAKKDLQRQYGSPVGEQFVKRTLVHEGIRPLTLLPLNETGSTRALYAADFRAVYQLEPATFQTTRTIAFSAANPALVPSRGIERISVVDRNPIDQLHSAVLGESQSVFPIADSPVRIRSVAMADLDVNGSIEYYVCGFDPSTYDAFLRSVDEQGNLRWSVNSSVPGYSKALWIEPCPWNGSPVPNTIASLWDSRTGPPVIQIHDAQGVKVESIRWDTFDRATSWFEVTNRWPGHSIVFLMVVKNEVIGFDSTGRSFQKFRTGSLLKATCVVATVFPNQPPILAILGQTRGYTHMTLLYLFDLQGNLLYRRLLGYNSGICVISRSGESDRLLVGDGNQLWLYRAVAQP